MEVGTLLLLVGAVLAASMLVGLGASRAGVPALVAFLALGMLLGSDGPGGIEFDDAELARTVGIVWLVAILYEGGLSTSWRRMRKVAVPAALLSTIGVVVTAFLTGLAAHEVFDLAWPEAILLGGVVASTDAAAVFATMRFTHIRRQARPHARGRDGRQRPHGDRAHDRADRVDRAPDFGFDDLVFLMVKQLGIGLVIGVVLGFVAMKVFAKHPGVDRRRSPRSRRSRWRRSRSASPTCSGAAASSPSTSSASPSAARPRSIDAISSHSTRGLRSWRR